MASRRTGRAICLVMPLPDKCSDGSLNVCVAPPHPCLARAVSPQPFLPLPHARENPPKRELRVLKSAGLRESARRVQVGAHMTFSIRRSTCRVLALPTNSNGDSPRSHEGVLGTLGSVPGEINRLIRAPRVRLCPRQGSRLGSYSRDASLRPTRTPYENVIVTSRRPQVTAAPSLGTHTSMRSPMIADPVSAARQRPVARHVEARAERDHGGVDRAHALPHRQAGGRRARQRVGGGGHDQRASGVHREAAVTVGASCTTGVGSLTGAGGAIACVRRVALAARCASATMRRRSIARASRRSESSSAARAPRACSSSRTRASRAS